MASFFRRKKPDAPSQRRYSTEELAAAFPVAKPAELPARIEPVPAPGSPTAPVHPVEPADTSAPGTIPTTADLEPAAPLPADAPTSAKAAPTPQSAGSVVDVVAPAAIAVPVAQPDGRPPLPPADAAMLREVGARQTLPQQEIPEQAWPEQASSGNALPEPVVSTQDRSGSEPSAAVLTASEIPDPAELPQSDPTQPAAAGKAGWRQRLRGSVFARSFGGLFSRNPKLDDDLLDEIETALLTADVGVGATNALVDDLRKRTKSREFVDARGLLVALRADLVAMLLPVAKPLQIDSGARPFVILTVGVNGVGKTTTIGKLARRFRDEDRSLMLAAGDTFRAAAVAQLQVWGERNGVPVVAQGLNASGKGGDAASVSFDALQAAKARGTEVLIADTAGRLHTQHGLMAELGKIKRVLAKVDPAAPHEVLMVIDGTTGQNALSQLRQFHAAVGVTGLVVTKLDGTAKGGVVFALAREFGIPIRYAGIGERPEDLRVFDAEAFVDALLPDSLGA